MILVSPKKWGTEGLDLHKQDGTDTVFFPIVLEEGDMDHVSQVSYQGDKEGGMKNRSSLAGRSESAIVGFISAIGHGLDSQLSVAIIKLQKIYVKEEIFTLARDIRHYPFTYCFS